MSDNEDMLIENTEDLYKMLRAANLGEAGQRVREASGNRFKLGPGPKFVLFYGLVGDIPGADGNVHPEPLWYPFARSEFYADLQECMDLVDLTRRYAGKGGTP